jgi:hypothetical protein
MKKELVLASAAALCVGLASGAFAKPTEEQLLERRCGNNGGGNGNEDIIEVVAGEPTGKLECVKFLPDGEEGDVDPN